MNTLFKFANFLYKHAYFLYKPLYFAYKHITDSNELLIYNKYINQGDTILDIGANVGFTTQYFSKITGDEGNVFSFEPDITNFEHLSCLVSNESLSNVTLINKAVSNNSDSIKIYTSDRLNVDHRTYKVDKYDTFYEIKAISIDEYFDDKKKIDFIKIDIQGYEKMAFLGMDKILTFNPNIIILSEFWAEGLKLADSSCFELIELFKKYQFNVYLIGKKASLQILTDEKIAEISKYRGDKFENILISRNALVK